MAIFFKLDIVYLEEVYKNQPKSLRNIWFLMRYPIANQSIPFVGWEATSKLLNPLTIC